MTTKIKNWLTVMAMVAVVSNSSCALDEYNPSGYTMDVKLSGRLSNHPEQYLFWDGKSNVWIWAVYVDDRRRHGYLDFPEKCG